MEIIIVGWHFEDAPYTCKDCGKHAAFVVTYKDGYDSFNLCEPCSRKYVVAEDQIDQIFKNLGM